MPRPLNLRQIEAFKAVVENGTVSRAAELMNITQPALSKLIAHLEFDAGIKLFDRVKGRLAPTEHAMRLHSEVERIFSGVRQVENALTAIRREEQGRLAVGTMAALAGSFVQQATSTFLRRRTNVFCSIQQLNSTWIVEWLVARKLDIGLVSARIDNPYVILEPLMELPLVCILPRGHQLAENTVIEPHHLDGTPFLTFQAETFVGRLVDEMLTKYSVQPNTILVSNVAPTLCEFVTAGLGVALVHPLMVSGLEDRLAVRRFDPEIMFHFQLCRSSDSRNAQLIDEFAHDLRTTAEAVTSTILNGH
jgi:DNA-binding transcriptional LysR family regulator